MVLLDGAAEGEGLAAAVLREAVLRLEGVVQEQVRRGERLAADRRVGVAALQDVDEGEQIAELAAALVLLRVADDQVVRHRAADDRVPLADARFDVLEDRVVGALEVQEVRAEGLPAEPERRRAGEVDVGARVELVVAEADLVVRVEVVVALDEEGLAGCLLRDGVERARLVVELRGQQGADVRQVRGEDARGVARRGRAAGVGHERRQRPLVALALEALEEEQPVADDRARRPTRRCRSCRTCRG